MIENILEKWAKNITRMNDVEINRQCGVRPYGIEYRIMLEGGAAQQPGSSLPDQMLSDVDLAWHRIGKSYPDQMTAVLEYYKRGSYRAVRLVLGGSQHGSVKLVKEGETMLKGALLMLW